MVVYRISNCQYIEDLTGKGAALYGGRWNSKDTYMVYTAETASLALLETVVHIGKIPEKGFCMLAMQLPPNSIETLAADKLPEGWSKNPAPDVLRKTGDDFIRAGRKLALKVPSVVMPEECNLLINPQHPDFKKIKVIKRRTIPIDERLLFATGK
jgi:RES domain-containing protein